MKVKWKGKTDFLVLTHNKIYDVLSVEKGWYRIFDDSGEDYLYSPENFEVQEDFTDDFTPEERARWEEMKNEPIKATILTEEEIDQLIAEADKESSNLKEWPKM